MEAQPSMADIRRGQLHLVTAALPLTSEDKQDNVMLLEDHWMCLEGFNKMLDKHGDDRPWPAAEAAELGALTQGFILQHCRVSCRAIGCEWVGLCQSLWVADI